MNKNNKQISLKPEQVATLVRIVMLEAVFCVVPAAYFFLCSTATEDVLFGAMPVLIQGEMPNILVGIGIMALGSVFVVRQIFELQSEAKKDQSR